MQRGQSILIHSGTGGVGQAAIHISLHYGCTVFTTVGSKEKKEFIKKYFPQIPADHIGNSRSMSFEQMIFEKTNGRGVDLVLNSLAEEKLQASVRCLARGGKFLEIGKFDLASNNSLLVQLFEKEISFDGIMLDMLFEGTPDIKEKLTLHLMNGIKSGAVKPLPRTVFQYDEIEKAFRYMASGKHVGKVIINVRPEENQKICSTPYTTFKGIPRYTCDPSGIYIIIGGLGGFGLELADWLITRGAKKLILTSRKGLKNGYQALRMRIWKSYGTNVFVRTDDTTTENGCRELLKFAGEFGPVLAVFNLAVVLKDALFENQSEEDFRTSLAPKAYTTKYLDAVTRELCPQLRDFVIFSSVSCGRGNAGQTNYGMGNSIMERICEQRKNDGFPALAIQWGAIGDVGLVAEMQEEQTELIIGGTVQQKIVSCLQVLDKLLRQDEPVVSSMVVAEKKATFIGANNIMDAVLNIIGIRDIKTISAHSTFPELGMDSMMAVEIKQVLEREFEVFLTPQDIRTMTFSKLQDIASEKIEGRAEPIPLTQDDLPLEIQSILKHIGDGTVSNVPVIEMKNVPENTKGATVHLLPGIDGMPSIFEQLAGDLHAKVLCFQYKIEDSPDTIEELTSSLIEHVDVRSGKFVIVAHSFGSLVAVEMVRVLEEKGCQGEVILIDGSPEYMKTMLRAHIQDDSEDIFQTALVSFLMRKYMSEEMVNKHKLDIMRCTTYKDKVSYMLNMSPKTDQSPEYILELCTAVYNRLRAVSSYQPSGSKIKSKVTLLKPTKPGHIRSGEDYGLSKIFENVEVKIFEGDHLSILENSEIGLEINSMLKGVEVNGKTPLGNVKMNSKNNVKQI